MFLAQSVQPAAPAAAYEPASQEVHTLAAELEYLPAAHGRQGVEAVAATAVE